MHLDIQTSGFSMTNALSRYVRHRLRAVLQRRDRHVMGAQVRLSDINGPKGGVDKQCQFCVDIAGAEPVVVNTRSSNMYAAIDTAVDKVKRSIGKRVSKLHDHRRHAREARAQYFDKYSSAI